MSFDTYAKTRDRGLAVRRYVFRHGPNADDFFAITDGPEDVVIAPTGASRVFFSLDTSLHMGLRGRLAIAKTAIRRGIEKIAGLIPAQSFDVGVGRFDSTASQLVKTNATLSDLDDLLDWVDAQTVSANEADYHAAVQFPEGWFSGAPRRCRFRSWVFVTAGFAEAATLPAAKEVVAPLVYHEGSDDLNYTETEIHPVVIRNHDYRDVRFLHNAPHLAIATIHEGNVGETAHRVGSVQQGGMTYLSLPIQVSGLGANGSPETKQEVSIKVGKDNPVALYYRDRTAQKPMLVTIHEGMADDPTGEFKLIFAGRVLSAKRQIGQNTVDLTAQPMTSAMKRNGLRRNYQYGCNHALYGDLCKASLEAATTQFEPTGSALDPGSRVLVVPPGTFVGSSDRYLGGLVWWRVGGTTVRRNIVQITGLNVLMDGPVGDAFEAPVIYLAYGCPHTYDFCKDVHIDSVTGLSNIVNYGGQRRIPIKNPFRFVSNYY